MMNGKNKTLPAVNSPFTIHYSLFTIHYSLFTIHALQLLIQVHHAIHILRIGVSEMRCVRTR